MPSDIAWASGERLVRDILGDPDDLWAAITSVSDQEWKAKRDTYRLHRFPSAHYRLWRIGKRICETYGGDARRIWDGCDARSTLEALWELGAGDQISRMIVGALRDCGQVHGLESDVKADVYVCRVLGRAILGDTTDDETAVRLARKLHSDPWQLDSELWNVGNRWCSKRNPKCQECYLAPHCVYAKRQSEKPAKNVAPNAGESLLPRRTAK